MHCLQLAAQCLIAWLQVEHGGAGALLVGDALLAAVNILEGPKIVSPYSDKGAEFPKHAFISEIHSSFKCSQIR